MADKLVLLNFWASSFAMRVKIALGEKGIEYESKEDDLFNKSPLLLEMNPIHKKVPVLIHDGIPISESLIIVQYIDEVWNQKTPLLPSDPYLRSQAKFWADYIDKKIYSTGKRVWTGKGEDQEAAKKELIECFKTLERELGDNVYFGGEAIGFVDVALVPFTSWFYTYQTFGNFNIEDECPKLVEWARRCLKRDSVVKALPDPRKIYGFALDVRKKFGIK